MKRTLGFWSVALLVACVRSEERPACSQAALLDLQAAYVRNVLESCVTPRLDDCPALPIIEERYARLREEWARCR